MRRRAALSEHHRSAAAKIVPFPSEDDDCWPQEVLSEWSVQAAALHVYIEDGRLGDRGPTPRTARGLRDPRGVLEWFAALAARGVGSADGTAMGGVAGT